MSLDNCRTCHPQLLFMPRFRLISRIWKDCARKSTNCETTFRSGWRGTKQRSQSCRSRKHPVDTMSTRPTRTSWNWNSRQRRLAAPQSKRNKRSLTHGRNTNDAKPIGSKLPISGEPLSTPLKTKSLNYTTNGTTCERKQRGESKHGNSNSPSGPLNVNNGRTNYSPWRTRGSNWQKNRINDRRR